MSAEYPAPLSNIVSVINTDFYQLTMAVAYYSQNIHERPVVFDLFHRTCPFGGEFTVFAGLDQVLAFLAHFRVTDEELAYLRSVLPGAPEGFFAWLHDLDCSGLRVFAPQQGTLVFPREPILRVEGPLGLCQLLETPLLNLVNFPSLIATNACRFKAVFPDKEFLEFGLRRAQGPDGALSASRYAIVGGFDATSNVMAGFLSPELRISGTMAHSFILAYESTADLRNRGVPVNLHGDQSQMTDDFVDFVCGLASGYSTPGNSFRTTGRYSAVCETQDFLQLALGYRERLRTCYAFSKFAPSDCELAAFIAFAQIWPHNFLALIDTFDSLASGLVNFISVACVLADAGWQPLGVRLDSGDLSYLSNMARNAITCAAERLSHPSLVNTRICASNDINERVLLSLQAQTHSIDVFGVGTHLVTCQQQPSLGGVYKLVDVDDTARIKLSEDAGKVTLPGRKEVYRLYGVEGPILDLIQLASEPAPEPGHPILCQHPTDEHKRANVIPSRVERLLSCVFDSGSVVLPLTEKQPAHHGPAPLLRGSGLMGWDLTEDRARCRQQYLSLRYDHTRPVNPTPYKVSVSPKLFALTRRLLLENTPICTLS